MPAPYTLPRAEPGRNDFAYCAGGAQTLAIIQKSGDLEVHAFRLAELARAAAAAGDPADLEFAFGGMDYFADAIVQFSASRAGSR